MSFELPHAIEGLPELPEVIAKPLLKLPEFEHLVDGDASIGWLMRSHEDVMGGRRIIGTCSMPTCQGRQRELFEWMVERILGFMPDFIITLELAYWLDGTPRQREILVYHELLHAVHKVDRHGTPMFDEQGRPKWGLRGHDVEEFSQVVERYGAHSEEIREFIAAAERYRGAVL